MLPAWLIFPIHHNLGDVLPLLLEDDANSDDDVSDIPLNTYGVTGSGTQSSGHAYDPSSSQKNPVEYGTFQNETNTDQRM